jgi:hypothetical protein
MRRFTSRSLFLAAGILAGGATTPHSVAKLPQYADQRLALLQRFLQRNACPINEFAEDFLNAADRNGLDWRLLPSISLLESGGGKDYENNNIFGWDNLKQDFPSIPDGIQLVASRLANSKLYRDKDLDDLLRTYNPARPDYPERVKLVMRQISAGPLESSPTLD